LALNIKTFNTRAVTALVFVIVMLAGLFINVWGFISLFLFIMAGCLYEFVKIMKMINGDKYFFYLPIALFYIIMPVCMMIDLGVGLHVNTSMPHDTYFLYDPLLPCVILFSIWINDTMAYLVGSFIGKTPFSPISPKKTWEGTIGGALLCVTAITIAGSFIPASKMLGWKNLVCISLICAVFGIVGDLLESKLKRMADIKDSGSFMPGHGGFLDRFDSMLIATPFVWLFIKLLF
jgi:phosphatidate cytidylyltransferase